MSDAPVGHDGGSGLAGVIGGLGFAAIPDVVDAAGLSTVDGPFLTADVVDEAGTVIGTVAVVDGPDGGDETLLDRLASVTAVELGGTVNTGEPVADGAAIAARFSIPIAVQVFGAATGPVIVSAVAADRRGRPDQATPSTAAGPAPVPGDDAGLGAGLGAGLVAAQVSGAGLEKLINVSLDVSVELGRTRVRLADVLDFDVGSVVELDRPAGAPVDVRVNDTLLAQGEVVLIDDEYAVRITAIFDPNKPQNQG